MCTDEKNTVKHSHEIKLSRSGDAAINIFFGQHILYLTVRVRVFNIIRNAIKKIDDLKVLKLPIKSALLYFPSKTGNLFKGFKRL